VRLAGIILWDDWDGRMAGMIGWLSDRMVEIFGVIGLDEMERQYDGCVSWECRYSWVAGMVG
jgi:hypothetical protein